MKKQKKTQQVVINSTMTHEEKKGVLNYLKKILTTGRSSVILALVSVIVTIAIYYANKTPEIEITKQETKVVADDILNTIPQDLTIEVKNDEALLVKFALGLVKTGSQNYLNMQKNALYDKINVDDNLSNALLQDMENRQTIISMTVLVINTVTKLQEKYSANYSGYRQINLNMANSVKNVITQSNYDNRVAEINNLLKEGKSKEAFEKLSELHNSLEIQEMYKSLFSYMKILTDILTPRYRELLRQEQESVQQ